MFVLCVLLAALFPRPGFAAEADPARARTVGVLTDNYPFSFDRGDGVPQGYVVDLLAAIERAMGLPLDRVVGPTGEINPAFRDGRLDLLQSYARSAERMGHAEFSRPYLTMAGSLFVRRGERGIRTLDDLRGRRVLVHRNSLGEQVLRAAGLGDSIVRVDSVEWSFRRLSAGEGDAVLAGRLSGMATIEHLGLRNLGAAGAPVEGYTVEYCFAARRGDTALVARIDEGLAILQRNGEAGRIYDRWFGRYDTTPFNFNDIALALSVGLAIALAIALWAWLRQRGLHRSLAAKAAALAANEEQYRGVFEASLDGLLLVRDAAEALVVERSNPAARLLLGEGVVAPGTRLAAGVPALQEMAARVRRAMAGEEPRAFEVAVDLSSVRLWLHVAVAAVGDRWLIVLGDFTAAKESEAKLEKIEQQQRQTQKLEAIGTLASGIAHDFNNILTGITGNAELARMEAPPDSALGEYLGEVLHGAERAAALVRQILTFSRQGAPRREAMHLTPVVKETLRFLRSTAPATIEIRHSFASGLPAVVCDPTQFHQVVLNLCTNSLYAMRDSGGLLEVRESVEAVGPDLADLHRQLRCGPHLHLTIRDTGCGMSPEVVQRVFEPFFTTKPVGEGTGLGLSVVHGIVRDHGGAITVYSTPGQGTVFHLYLPAAAASAKTADARDSEFPRGAGQRILVVDDEPAVASVAGMLLRHLGYEVTVFSDPAKALEGIRSAPASFDLVLSDLTMPGIDGVEVAMQVRTLRPDLPVVLASGYKGEKAIARAQTIGIECFIEKPLTLPVLGRAVAEVFRAG